jgi:hypothetical protein
LRHNLPLLLAADGPQPPSIVRRREAPIQLLLLHVVLRLWRSPPGRVTQRRRFLLLLISQSMRILLRLRLCRDFIPLLF